jgi:CRP-like cAMP-binding protein
MRRAASVQMANAQSCVVAAPRGCPYAGLAVSRRPTWSLLEALPPEDRSAVLSGCRRVMYEPRSAVVAEGQRADTLYFVEQGHMSVRVAGQFGSEAVVNLMGPGDSFGELGLIGDGHRTASIWTFDRTELIGLHRTQFERLREQRPAVDRALVCLMYDSIVRLTGLLAELMTEDNEVRLARRMLRAAQVFDDVESDVVPVTQQMLGSMAHIGRRRMSDVYGRLVDRGLVATAGRGGFRVLDADGLRQAAGLAPAPLDLEGR